MIESALEQISVAPLRAMTPVIPARIMPRRGSIANRGIIIGVEGIRKASRAIVITGTTAIPLSPAVAKPVKIAKRTARAIRESVKGSE